MHRSAYLFTHTNTYSMISYHWKHITKKTLPVYRFHTRFFYSLSYFTSHNSIRERLFEGKIREWKMYTVCVGIKRLKWKEPIYKIAWLRVITDFDGFFFFYFYIRYENRKHIIVFIRFSSNIVYIDVFRFRPCVHFYLLFLFFLVFLSLFPV